MPFSLDATLVQVASFTSVCSDVSKGSNLQRVCCNPVIPARHFADTGKHLYGSALV
jgi:hypothetical protein